MDVGILASLVVSGASLVGTTVAQEATKDAYRSLKSLLGRVLGSKFSRAAEKLEKEPGSSVVIDEVSRIVDSLDQTDWADIETGVSALVRQFEVDQGAKAWLATIGIDIDIVLGGNALIRDLESSGGVRIKAKTEGDFELTGVRSGVIKRPGK